MTKIIAIIAKIIAIIIAMTSQHNLLRRDFIAWQAQESNEKINKMKDDSSNASNNVVDDEIITFPVR